MPAFQGKTLRKSSIVGAIIIYHEILLNPSQPSPAISIELLILPCSVWESWIARLHVEVAIIGRKWRTGPISFHKPTSCRPIVSIPEAWVYSHWLVLWERDTNWFGVLEHPNRSVVHQETETGKFGSANQIRTRTRKVVSRLICLHNVLGLPYDWIGVEILSGIEPEIELLLPVSFPLCEDISVEDVRITRDVP